MVGISVDVRSLLIENRFCCVLSRFQLELSFLFKSVSYPFLFFFLFRTLFSTVQFVTWFIVFLLFRFFGDHFLSIQY